MEEFKFSYDKDSDDLFVYLEGHKSAGAIELGSFILDFNTKGNLIAMQILNVSEVFSKILSKIIQLSKITQVKIDMINIRNMNAIKFSISDGTNEEKASLFIPHIKEKSPVLSY